MAGFLGTLVGAVIGVLVSGPSFGGLLVATVFAGGGALLLDGPPHLFSKTVPWAFAATVARF